MRRTVSAQRITHSYTQRSRRPQNQPWGVACRNPDRPLPKTGNCKPVRFYLQVRVRYSNFHWILDHNFWCHYAATLKFCTETLMHLPYLFQNLKKVVFKVSNNLKWNVFFGKNLESSLNKVYGALKVQTAPKRVIQHKYWRSCMPLKLVISMKTGNFQKIHPIKLNGW